MVDAAHCHCSPIHGKYRDIPRYYDVDYPLEALLRLLPAHNNHLISTCKQLDTACHQWNNSDVFTFPNRLMPECQVIASMDVLKNKAGEGASNGKKDLPNNICHRIPCETRAAHQNSVKPFNGFTVLER